MPKYSFYPPKASDVIRGMPSERLQMRRETYQPTVTIRLCLTRVDYVIKRMQV